MDNRFLCVLIFALITSCVNRGYDNIYIDYNPRDSSISISDSLFFIRKVVIENNHGKRFYESIFGKYRVFKLFSDKNYTSKCLILDSIRSDTMTKYIYIKVRKKENDEPSIEFNSMPFRKFNEEIELKREKLPFP